MSSGPKNNFRVSLGYFWDTETLDCPICTIDRKTSTFTEKFVCLQGILGTFLRFPTIWTVFACNISTKCSGWLLWHLWIISERFSQFKHSLLPFWQKKSFHAFPSEIWQSLRFILAMTMLVSVVSFEELFEWINCFSIKNCSKMKTEKEPKFFFVIITLWLRNTICSK